MKLFWPIDVSKDGIDGALAKLGETTLNKPFDETVIAFTTSLSKQLLQLRQHPELMALGYWLRKSNILDMKKTFLESRSHSILKARGTVFHVAPSNVDTIFVYSWLLALLAGNRNVIRVSSKDGVGTNTLINTIIAELAKPEFSTIASKTIICTYEHDNKLTEKLSLSCHTRVIWGGDATIQRLRSIPLAPLANELAFADRFSLAAFNSEQVLRLDEQQLVHLTEQFYNDSFWFNQLACSSPKLIIWTGASQDDAQKKFWPVFEQTIRTKQYQLTAAVQVLKLTTAMQLAVKDEVSGITNHSLYSKVKFNELSQYAREVHCGGGLFYEYNVDRLIDVIHLISDKDQTLTYFGFESTELVAFINDNNSRGIDRIVPIGSALNFDGIWDGQNFLSSFTREVLLK